MDSRADLQRFVEGIDQVIQAKSQELAEVDERLEAARKELSEREAKELRDGSSQSAYNNEYPETLMSKQQIDELVGKLKNTHEQQLDKIADELERLEQTNKSLQNDNDSLRRELSNFHQINEKLTDQYEIMIQNYNEIKSANFDLNMRLAKAENESQIQQKLLRRTHQEDEFLMKAFNEKMDSLKKAIDLRDKEIGRLEKLCDTREPNDEIQKRDQQIESLKVQLIQATNDLEENASMLEKLVQANGLHDLANYSQFVQFTAKNDNINQGPNSSLSTTGNMTKFRTELERVLARKCEALENEIEIKDEQLHQIELRNHELEGIVTQQVTSLLNKCSIMLDFFLGNESNNFESFVDGLKVITELRSQLESFLNLHNHVQKLLDQNENLKLIIQKRDVRIRQLANDLSRYDAALNNDEDLKDEDGANQTTVPVQVKENLVENPNSVDIEMVQQVETPIPKEEESRDKDEEERNEIPDPVEKDQSIKEAMISEVPLLNEAGSQCDELDSGPGQSANKHMPKDKESRDEQVTIESYKERIRVLEDENQLYELAIRDIHLSIKWTDSQCNTVLLDCPSLDKFSQLIEAKFLATKPFERDISDNNNNNNDTTTSPDLNSYIFQILILKSELDLVRGQNEQLRVDLKSQRRDYLDKMEELREGCDEALVQINQQTNEDKTKDNKNNNQNETNNKISSNIEVECQTEPITKNVCKNCQKLTRRNNQLMESIIRIEERLHMSDQTYTDRLMCLYNQIQLLQKDLASRDIQLNDLRQKYHILNRQKCFLESQIQHYRIVNQPKNHLMNQKAIKNVLIPEEDTPTNKIQKRGDLNISSLTTINNHHHHATSHPSFPVSRPLELPITGNAKMTISLLQSMINCLQVRLRNKDESLKRVESLLLNGVPRYTCQNNNGIGSELQN